MVMKMYCVIMLLLAGVVLEVDSKKGDLHLDITVLLSPKMLSRLASAIAKAGRIEPNMTDEHCNKNISDICVIQPTEKLSYVEARDYCSKHRASLPTYSESVRYKTQGNNVTWLQPEPAGRAEPCHVTTASHHSTCPAFIILSGHQLLDTCQMHINCYLRRHFYCVRKLTKKDTRRRRRRWLVT